MKSVGFTLLPLLLLTQTLALADFSPSYVSNGRMPDSTQKVVSEIRDAERRQIPLDVELKSSNDYPARGPVTVTLLVTNLFDSPLLFNRRMLINHPRLKGEVAFRIIGPDGKICPIQRLVTPMTLDDGDFVVLNRGQSVQRTIDVADFYTMKQKGTYRMIVFYHNEEDHPRDGLRTWRGIVASDAVDITLR